MKLFRKKMKLNNKGLSLVELVCAVAIFGLATTAIGGAMVVSAQSYSRGTYELDVQQEAQTTTNLIGDLLFDATGASFDDTVANPILKIKQEGIEYHITYDKNSRILKYEEYVSGSSDPATGILAENVSDFKVPGLDAAGNNFQTNKNVEIKVAISKNSRVYEAKYNTTARNGAAESVGVAESAEIIIESPIVLEPGQTYSLPYEVVGTIMNKSISLSDNPGVSVVQEGSNIKITVASNASGSIPFTVATIEPAKDASGNPIAGSSLASKDVQVLVRRVDAITSPMDADDNGEADTNALVSGVSCKNGAEYRIDFEYVGDYLDKVFGKAYDMDYVNPKQLNISVTMTGMEPGLSQNDYISGVQIDGLDNPYVKFNLIKDMPSGSEITITATAAHPAGTNKTTNAYATVKDEIKIKYVKSLFGQSDFLRGSDGVFVIDAGMLKDIEKGLKESGLTADPQNSKRYLLTIFEVKDDGSLVTYSGIENIKLNTDENFKIDMVHSEKLDPRKRYAYQIQVMYYTDTSRNTQLWPVSPYISDCYPLDAVDVIYEPQTTESTENGTSKQKAYKINLNGQKTIYANIWGLNTTRFKNNIKFTVEKWQGDTLGYQKVTSGYDISCNSGAENTGEFKMYVIMREKGDFRIKAKIDNFQYKSYDGNTTLTANYTLPGGEYEYFYIHVE